MNGRKYLGRDLVPILWSLIGYRSVFEIDDGLEVDEVNLVVVERTRVYFDDVLAITFHQVPGVGFLVTTGICALILGTGAVSAIVDGSPIPGVILGIIALAFFVAFLLRLSLKVSVISVFGKRTQARIKIPMRTERARQIYRDLTAKIRASQEKAAAAQPKPPPPPAVPLPPSPPPPAAP